MTKIITDSSSAAGIRVTLASGEGAFVAAGADIGSTDSAAISGLTGSHIVNVQGSVSGVGSAISLGGSLTGDKQTLYVGNDGYVAGFTYGATLAGSGSIVENRGTIWGSTVGLRMNDDQLDTLTRIENLGLIEGVLGGISHTGLGTLQIKNFGEIRSFASAFVDFGGAADNIINKGEIYGSIAFGGGNDSYDGRKGYLEGPIDGGAGDDRLIGGIEDNDFGGGAGHDTLTGGLGADQFSFAEFGAANADTITDFNVKEDTVGLYKLNFTELELGTLAKDDFVSNKTGFAGDTSDRIIYETDTGRLFYDADGKGGTAGELFATVAIGTKLTFNDFSVLG